MKRLARPRRSGTHSLRVPSDLEALVATEAEAQGRSFPDLVRVALRFALGSADFRKLRLPTNAAPKERS